jgi:uncharacterized protein (TIGR00299 family) protein
MGILDPSSGISGDMFVGAFIDAGIRLADLEQVLICLNLENVNICAEKVVKHGIAGTKFNVAYGEEGEERTLSSVAELVGRSSLSAKTIDRAIEVFRALAEAESRVHARAVDEVHFHEVGAIDSIVDIVLGCACVELACLDVLYSAEISVGSGTVDTAHGRLPLPSPATLELLKRWRLRHSGVEGELTTPTGAALVSVLAEPIPAGILFAPDSIGYGAGVKEIDSCPNLLRLTLAESDAAIPSRRVKVVDVTLDDVSGEVIGYLCVRLLEMGALEVFSTGVQMKKSRPGTMLTVLLRDEKLPEVGSFLLRETGSLGFRFRDEERVELPRSIERVATELGEIRVKIAKGLDGRRFASPEYEDCASIARRTGMPLSEIYAIAVAAWEGHEAD